MSAALEQLADEIAAEVATRSVPVILGKLREMIDAERPNPLLTVAESSKYLALSRENIRLLIEQGHIKKAPGLLETKIRKSELDAYGVSNPRPAKSSK